MSVKIDLDLRAGDVMTQLETIRGELESMDDLDLGLDLDVGDQLDDIGDQLDEIGADFRADMDAGVTRLEDIEDINFGNLPRFGGDSGGDTGSDSGDGNVPSVRSGGGGEDGRSQSLKSLWKAQNRDVKEIMGRAGLDFDDFGGKSGDSDGFSKFFGLGDKRHLSKMSNLRGPHVRSRRLFDIPEGGPYHLPGFEMPEGDSILQKMRKARGDSDGGNFFKKAIPNMRTWYRILGAIIPMLATMIVQASGVAIAMGGVAVAGASLVGLGLIGHGESMAEAWGNAKRQLSQLKQEMFEASQPAAQAFAPISEEFLDWAPSQVNKLAHSLKGLVAFEDITFGMFRGITDWLGEMAKGMVANQHAVTQLAERFGRIIGIGILNLFQWLTEEAAANQDMLIELGGAFVDLAQGLYQIFLIVSRLVIALTPLFTAFAWIGKALNGSVIGAIAIAATVMGIAAYAAMGLGSALLALREISLVSTFPAIASLIAELDAFTLSAIASEMAALGLAESLSVLASVATMGLAIPLSLWAGGKALKGISQANDMKKQMSRSQDSSADIYNEGDTNFNVDGDIDSPTLEAMKDVAMKENGISMKREKPTPGNSRPGGS